jgi:hypothetical protein
MDGQWMTWEDAAARLGVSRDAVRRRAARHCWGRTKGNDGRARVQVPDEAPKARPGAAQEGAPTLAPTLIAALEAHIATLKAELDASRAAVAQRDEQLASARAAADKATAELVELAETSSARACARGRAGSRGLDCREPVAERQGGGWSCRT